MGSDGVLPIYLTDGTSLTARPLVAGDRPLLVGAFEAFSGRSRYQRFFSPLHQLQPSHLDLLTDLDQLNRFAWAAVVADGDRERLIAVARYIRGDDPRAAEIALAVIDDYQRRGLGTVLLRALAHRAVSAGITRFDGLVLRENVPMLQLLRGAGARFQGGGAGTLAFTVDLPTAA